jgi:hypothetical protein
MRLPGRPLPAAAGTAGARQAPSGRSRPRLERPPPYGNASPKWLGAGPSRCEWRRRRGAGPARRLPGRPLPAAAGTAVARLAPNRRSRLRLGRPPPYGNASPKGLGAGPSRCEWRRRCGAGPAMRLPGRPLPPPAGTAGARQARAGARGPSPGGRCTCLPPRPPRACRRRSSPARSPKARVPMP